ncbi:hypothetical protein FALBO_12590 [Fusarium albosuccineum]|uniref:Uncharacterized protein n=1 Tax=Fusarium albosuccineum TaxID=1237068 RepID=A0A8H4L2V7_9HYPO|nr:hypothetical protein FALBO_12590 [Fusarium albosuccineum]
MLLTLLGSPPKAAPEAVSLDSKKVSRCPCPSSRALAPDTAVIDAIVDAGLSNSLLVWAYDRQGSQQRVLAMRSDVGIAMRCVVPMHPWISGTGWTRYGVRNPNLSCVRFVDMRAWAKQGHPPSIMIPIRQSSERKRKSHVVERILLGRFSKAVISNARGKNQEFLNSELITRPIRIQKRLLILGFA